MLLHGKLKFYQDDMLFEINTNFTLQAILLTRDQDLELEAIAHSKLGEVYDKVLKLRQKAKENFTRCLELVNLMVPRTFHSKGTKSQIMYDCQTEIMVPFSDISD